MSFDLRISFTGVCLFTPDVAPASPAQHRMHVLLPAFGTGDHHHHARLVYDVAYLTGAPGLARRLDCVPLEGGYLEILSPGALNAAFPREVVSLDPIMSPERLPRSYVSDAPGPLVSSRVTLASGAVSNYEVGAHFEVGEVSARRMTWQLEWTVRGIESDRLALDLRPFTTQEDEPSPPVPPRELFPIGDTIRLFVYNVTCQDLPPLRLMDDFPVGAEVEHFKAYYQLYGASASGKSLPKIFGTEFTPEDVDCGCGPAPGGGGHGLHGAAGDEPRADGVAAEEDDASASDGTAPPPEMPAPAGGGGMGGRPFTCMLSYATLQP